MHGDQFRRTALQDTFDRVPESLAPEVPQPAMSGAPVAPSAQIPQRERTRLLHDDLAQVVNAHAASPETVLMALELLRHQALAPRMHQMALE